MKLLFDTNAIIDFLKNQNPEFDIPSLLVEHECMVSVIVKLELLKSPAMPLEEEKAIHNFLQFVPIIPLNDSIVDETIRVSRSTGLKLPDAIIGATAVIYGAEIVTRETHFLKCQHENIRIWKTPDIKNNQFPTNS